MNADSTLVLKMDHIVSREQVVSITAYAQSVVGHDRRVLVLQPGMSAEIVDAGALTRIEAKLDTLIAARVTIVNQTSASVHALECRTSEGVTLLLMEEAGPVGCASPGTNADA